MGQKQIHSTEAESFQHKLQRAANEEFSLESAHSRVRRRDQRGFLFWGNETELNIFRAQEQHLVWKSDKWLNLDVGFLYGIVSCVDTGRWWMMVTSCSGGRREYLRDVCRKHCYLKQRHVEKLAFRAISPHSKTNSLYHNSVMCWKPVRWS